MSSKISQQFPDAVYQKLPLPWDHPHYRYNGFHQNESILEKGHARNEGAREFGIHVLFTRDVGITVRDGVVLYADIFRPVDADVNPVPVILPWSAYGKTGTGPQSLDSMAPFRAAVPVSRTSGYEKFEAPDPAEWCERGYAIINIDARGAGHSQGDIAFWGQQEAEDIYDVIDWLVKQPWCNGSVCMAGNSWLAISQVNFASRLSHPALKALAPWESYTDLYRQVVARGGRPHQKEFHKLIISGFAGSGYVEDPFSMLDKHPLYDEYWEAKRIPVERIGDIPLYITASYSTMIHTQGSIDVFRNAKSTRKWLRIHPYQEWHDLYRSEINDDLQKFFDFYCKGIQNDWETSTPPVRLSLLGFEGSLTKTVVERPENEYPLARQVLKTYFLNATTRTLNETLDDQEAHISHKGHSLTATSDFILRFTKYTEVAGFPKVKLWMSCNEHDDFDVAVQIRKIDPHGNLLEHVNYPCPVPHHEIPNVNTVKCLGPQGFLRASHAVSIDQSTAETQEVLYRHDIREPIPLGEVVPLEITLWAMGMAFSAGEGVMLRVSGHDMCLPEVEPDSKMFPDDENRGMHNVFSGGRYDSTLLLPVIPERVV